LKLGQIRKAVQLICKGFHTVGACFESKRYNFSEGYHLLSQTIRREQISFIFDYAQNGGDKSALLENIA